MCFARNLGLSLSRPLRRLPPSAPATTPEWGIFKREPRYKIEAVSFRCHNETGIDWPWSDTVVVNFFVPELHYSMEVGVFHDVDSSETRLFEPDASCILPVGDVSGQVYSGDSIFLHSAVATWTCSDAGISGPFGFTVEMFEFDFYEGNVVFGERTILFTAEELAAALPNVNDSVDETILLNCPGPAICGGAYLTSYSFTYRITRLPDALVGPVSSIPIEEAPVESDPGPTP
jgi:hypothetical protein